jgi:hypothetical protein
MKYLELANRFIQLLSARFVSDLAGLIPTKSIQKALRFLNNA